MGKGGWWGKGGLKGTGPCYPFKIWSELCPALPYSVPLIISDGMWAEAWTQHTPDYNTPSPLFLLPGLWLKWEEIPPEPKCAHPSRLVVRFDEHQEDPLSPRCHHLVCSLSPKFSSMCKRSSFPL